MLNEDTINISHVLITDMTSGCADEFGPFSGCADGSFSHLSLCSSKCLSATRCCSPAMVLHFLLFLSVQSESDDNDGAQCLINRSHLTHIYFGNIFSSLLSPSLSDSLAS